MWSNEINISNQWLTLCDQVILIFQINNKIIHLWYKFSLFLIYLFFSVFNVSDFSNGNPRVSRLIFGHKFISFFFWGHKTCGPIWFYVVVYIAYWLKYYNINCSADSIIFIGWLLSAVLAIFSIPLVGNCSIPIQSCARVIHPLQAMTVN